MRGYVNIPTSINCRACKVCGARPIVALVEDGGYVVKCPTSDSHYHTLPGLIDIDDWNRNNTLVTDNGFERAVLVSR